MSAPQKLSNIMRGLAVFLSPSERFIERSYLFLGVSQRRSDQAILEDSSGVRHFMPSETVVYLPDSIMFEDKK